MDRPIDHINKETDPNTHVVNSLGDTSSLVLESVDFAGKCVVVTRATHL